MPKNIPFFLPFPSVPFGLHAQEVSSQLGDVFYGKNTSKAYLLGGRFFLYFLTSSIYASYDQYWKKKISFFFYVSIPGHSEDIPYLSRYRGCRGSRETKIYLSVIILAKKVTEASRCISPLSARKLTEIHQKQWHHVKERKILCKIAYIHFFLWQAVWSGNCVFFTLSPKRY